MRLIPIILMSVALATSAGCFGKDDGGDGETPTPTTPAVTTPAGTTPATGGTPATNNTNDTNTTPPAPAPREVCTVSKAFSSNVPTPPATTAISTADCGTVAAGHTTLTLNVTFAAESGAPVFVTQAVSVKVLDSTGTAVLTCAGPGPGQAADSVCTQEATAAPGAYTLSFEGSGNVQATGNVMAS